MDKIHRQVLKKFNALKGKKLEGQAPIKGLKKDELVPPDEYVEEPHMMHGLIRGLYKPAKKDYLLSYQATESEDNYGKQIRWIDKEDYSYKIIEMYPPNSPKDNRRKSDINAARHNMKHKMPIGILFRISKGINIVLGLGIITKERNDGVFIIEPYEQQIHNEINYINDFINEYEEPEDLLTDVLRETKQRYGQNKFRDKLKREYETCALCDINKEHSVASHIKPWSQSNNRERLDVENGLLLCPNHDYLFDKALITFDPLGEIMISSKLNESEIREFGLLSSMKIDLTKRSSKYLSYHRENLFKKTENKD